MQTINPKEIFCVFDFNKESQLALAYASALALNSTAHLHIIYVMEHFAAFVRSILKHPKIGQFLGANGKEHVRKNFLMTRHVIDDLKLLNKVLNDK